jgi:hypothetical protein
VAQDSVELDVVRDLLDVAHDSDAESELTELEPVEVPGV